VFCSCLAGAGNATAQEATVSVRGMVVSADPATRGAVGAGAMLEVTDRVGVVADLDYFTFSGWSSTLTGTGAVAVALGRSGWSDRAMPYVFAGGGVQRARVALGNGRVMGVIPDSVGTGARFCAAEGSGPNAAPLLSASSACAGVSGWGVGELPDFYARQLTVLVVPDERRWPDAVFVDPVVIAGGGLRMRAGEHWVLAPEARLWVVFAGGDQRLSGLIGATLGYRF
jgi:hypothetical protein